MLAARLATIGAAVSAEPRDARDGWLEVVESGLVFDLHGLAPGKGALLPHGEARLIGVDPGLAAASLEAVTIAPGEHIKSAARQVPVMRAMCSLAALLGDMAEAQAVCWQPARTWIEPRYFSGVIGQWLAGGPFPAPGLIAFERLACGDLATHGLSYFTGQELVLRANGADAPHFGTRIVDMLVAHGRVTVTQVFDGPDGNRWNAKPSSDGHRVLIERKG